MSDYTDDILDVLELCDNGKCIIDGLTRRGCTCKDSVKQKVQKVQNFKILFRGQESINSYSLKEIAKQYNIEWEFEDEILLGLYRKYNLSLTRRQLTAKLYNMSKKNIIKRLKGKKGLYQYETKSKD